jgi:hypothetical protein
VVLQKVNQLSAKVETAEKRAEEAEEANKNVSYLSLLLIIRYSQEQDLTCLSFCSTPSFSTVQANHPPTRTRHHLSQTTARGRPD